MGGQEIGESMKEEHEAQRFAEMNAKSNLGQGQSGTALGRGALLGQYDDNCVNAIGRQSLRDSLFSRLSRAQSSANEVAKLRRFIELLDKHPDFIEILEIIRDLNLL